MSAYNLYQSRFILLSFFAALLICQTIHAKKKTTTHTFVTEMWKEVDYLGAGYHITWDKIRPNIWVRIRRTDGELSSTIGLPNNVMAGANANWDIPYDDNNLYSRLPDDSLATLNLDGECLSDGRCYGDWINNDELWEESVKPGAYKDSEGKSYLLLQFPGQAIDDPHGASRTRFRFDIFIEDNTPYWLRDPDFQQGSAVSEQYNDWDNSESPAEPYYPLKRVVFRITSASSAATNDTRQREDIFYTDRNMEKPGFEDLFKINNLDVNPIEQRIRWGKHVYSVTEFFDFPSEGQFYMEVSAIDMEDNRRVLRVPINIEKLRGLKLSNESSDATRN